MDCVGGCQRCERNTLGRALLVKLRPRDWVQHTLKPAFGFASADSAPIHERLLAPLVWLDTVNANQPHRNISKRRTPVGRYLRFIAGLPRLAAAFFIELTVRQPNPPLSPSIRQERRLRKKLVS